MKAGDLVRCRLKDRIGIVIQPPRTHGYDRRPGTLLRVLWNNSDTPIYEHINGLEVINATG